MALARDSTSIRFSSSSSWEISVNFPLMLRYACCCTSMLLRERIREVAVFLYLTAGLKVKAKIDSVSMRKYHAKSKQNFHYQQGQTTVTGPEEKVKSQPSKSVALLIFQGRSTKRMTCTTYGYVHIHVYHLMRKILVR